MDKYFTKAEAIERIIDTLEWYTGHYCDLHNEVFNTDYYIIGTWEAKKALEQYGTWEAIGKIQEYEESNYGELYTDLTDAEKVANMLWYIIGEEVVWEVIGNYYMNRVADDDINSEIIEHWQEELEEA